MNDIDNNLFYSWLPGRGRVPFGTSWRCRVHVPAPGLQAARPASRGNPLARAASYRGALELSYKRSPDGIRFCPDKLSL